MGIFCIDFIFYILRMTISTDEETQQEFFLSRFLKVRLNLSKNLIFVYYRIFRGQSKINEGRISNSKELTIFLT